MFLPKSFRRYSAYSHSQHPSLRTSCWLVQPTSPILPTCRDPNILPNSRTYTVQYRPQKKDLYRREGKGSRYCLGEQKLLQFIAALAILHQDD